MRVARSIVLMGTWFGPWPVWIDFFMISCEVNRDIDWLIFTDQAAPESTPANVEVVTMTFADYKALVGAALGITVHKEAQAYKLCDLRPALGQVHRDRIRSYDFFGFTDFDVVYGRIRSVYGTEILDSFDAFGSHVEHVSGHLFLMRNTREMRTAFEQIPKWRQGFEDAAALNLDEQGFTPYFNNRRKSRSILTEPGRRPVYFREAFSTPMPTRDMRWYWRPEYLSNDFYPHKSFLYLHFMAWHSSKHYDFLEEVVRGTRAPWEDRDDVVQIDWREARTKGFMISPAGIQPIAARTYP